VRHNDVIYLVSIEIDYDDIGNSIETLSKRLVYANENEVGVSEFYNASVAGLKPEKRFEIYSFEYQGEDRVEHNDNMYRVIRASTRGEKTRLTCERVIADV